VVEIFKHSGRYESFNGEKLLKSLLKAGVSEEDSKQIVAAISDMCYPGISSDKIHQAAVRQLEKKSKILRANYSLKKSLLGLGPSGYAFEKLIAKLFELKKYSTQVSVTNKGKCVTHEIDVIAKNSSRIEYVECKFHNNPGKKNDVKTSLYVHARAMDLKNNPENIFDDFWIISNSVFSEDALAYANCSGIKVLCLNYPMGNNLYQEIQKYALYPISSIKKLKRYEVMELIENDIITCFDLMQRPEILPQILGNEAARIFKVLEEVHLLTGVNSCN
jgi:hypothetical protein